MKSSLALLLAAAPAGGGWLPRPATETVRTHRPEEPEKPGVSGARTSLTSPLAVTAQSQADAAQVLASPLGFLQSLNGQSSLTGRSRILAAVGAMPQGEFRTGVVSQITSAVQTWSYSDPEAAASKAASLTQNNPQDAIVWSQGLTPGPAQNEAYAGIAEKWAAYDATAASQWLTGLPGGEGRDLSADKLVSVIARDDPDSASQWALSISDRGKRREAAARTLEAWKAYGAKDAALTALQAGGFTGHELLELQRKLD